MRDPSLWIIDGGSWGAISWKDPGWCPEGGKMPGGHHPEQPQGEVRASCASVDNLSQTTGGDLGSLASVKGHLEGLFFFFSKGK